MRALLIYPELPPSFWSLRGSLRLTGQKTLLPPLSLITVAALLPQEWEFRLVDLNTRGLKDDDWQWADLVLLSGMMVQREGVLGLIREARQRGKTVVVGGPYSTSLPQEVLDAGTDFLLQGEAEETVSLLLAALAAGQQKGVFKETAKPDLTSSPTPRFDLVNFADYIAMGVQTSRGCPFNCEFCDIVSLYGRTPRYKDPAQVLKELQVIYDLGWRKTVFFCDDNFIGNKDQARSLLNLLIPWMKSVGEPFDFWTQASVNLGQDLEMIDLLTAANFSNIFVGVETPDAEVLSANRKYQNVKHPLGESLANINANGLSVLASFMIGFDGEGKGAGERICRFVEEYDLPLVALNTLQVLPNTALWERLRQEGRLLPERTSGNMTGCRLNYRPTRPEAEILGEYRDAVDRLYERSGYLSRNLRSILAMRPTRRALAQQKSGGENPGVAGKSRLQQSNWEELASLLRLIWVQGIQSSCRWQFWRQLWEVYRRNPSRLIKYLHNCGMGENLEHLRQEMLRQRAAGQ